MHQASAPEVRHLSLEPLQRGRHHQPLLLQPHLLPLQLRLPHRFLPEHCTALQIGCLRAQMLNALSPLSLGRLCLPPRLCHAALYHCLLRLHSRLQGVQRRQGSHPHLCLLLQQQQALLRGAPQHALRPLQLVLRRRQQGCSRLLLHR